MGAGSQRDSREGKLERDFQKKTRACGEGAKEDRQIGSDGFENREIQLERLLEGGLGETGISGRQRDLREDSQIPES